MTEEKRITSMLESSLEQGSDVDVDIIAIKNLLADEITRFLHLNSLSKTKMAARLKISRRALDRLLDPTKSTITLKTLNQAARFIGKKLQLGLVNDK